MGHNINAWRYDTCLSSKLTEVLVFSKIGKKLGAYNAFKIFGFYTPPPKKKIRLKYTSMTVLCSFVRDCADATSQS